MAEPYLSEIRMVAFGFAPKGWALCNGTTMSIEQNQGMYALMGTVFGGDGLNTFALPDLRGRVPVHAGSDVKVGEKGGAETVALTVDEIGAHRHSVIASSTLANTNKESNVILAQAKKSMAPVNFYRDVEATNMAAMNPDAVLEAGGGQPHNNMQPYLTVSFCIAITGEFPMGN